MPVLIAATSSSVVQLKRKPATSGCSRRSEGDSGMAGILGIRAVARPLPDKARAGGTKRAGQGRYAASSPIRPAADRERHPPALPPSGAARTRDDAIDRIGAVLDRCD